MLIEFRVTNYRSFRETQTLSMVSSAAKEHQETHTIDSGAINFHRLLASSAIYGPNAAGKTNLLRALQFMQSVILGSAAPNPTVQVAYTPFKFDIITRGTPSEFEITFVQDNIRYNYGFTIDSERIYSEYLVEYRTKNPTRLFERCYVKRKEGYDWKFSSTLRGNRFVWRDATRDNALFLTTAVRLNSTQLLPVFSWFQTSLVCVVGNTTLNMGITMGLLDQPNGKERLLPFLQEADLGIRDVEVEKEPLLPNASLPQGVIPFIFQDSPNSMPFRAKITFMHHAVDSSEDIGLDISDESNGTQTLFITAGAWLNVFTMGQVLLIDEIDNSLHSLLVRFLISRFHSREHNKNKSQLVFTTHNLSLLDTDLFRRDQIWFVEKSPSGCSKLYPLSDFSPRKEEDIRRGYERGRYGALPLLSDLSV